MNIFSLGTLEMNIKSIGSGCSILVNAYWDYAGIFHTCKLGINQNTFTSEFNTNLEVSESLPDSMQQYWPTFGGNEMLINIGKPKL